jgi:hypothetical protein
VLHSRRSRGIHDASLELYRFSRYVDAESCISKFVQLVRRLPPSARRRWNAAMERQFNIGIQAASKGETFTTLITTATLGSVAAVGGEIVITIYTPLERRRR